MTAFLRRPYPFELSIPRRIAAAVLFGVFVSAFLVFFEPFGIRNMPEGKLAVSAGFGTISFLTMLLLGLLPPVFPNVFSEERWTVGRELLWILLHLVLIGIGNAVFACYTGLGEWTLRFFLIYQGYTVGIGIFPICVSVLVREVNLSRRYREASAGLNLQRTAAKPDTAAGTITLPSDNRNEALSLHPDELVYIAAADNYVTVWHLTNGAVRKTVLRSTLKAQEEQLAGVPSVFRVHKSYLVNADHIARVSGNAQGYRLHLPGIESGIPVSRRQNDELRRRLTARDEPGFRVIR